MPQSKVIKVIKKAIFDSNESALLPNKTDHKKVLIRSKVMFVLEKTFFVIAQPYLVEWFLYTYYLVIPRIPIQIFFKKGKIK